jgi:hypothetical protein
MVEQLTLNQLVPGSSPGGGTKLRRTTAEPVRMTYKFAPREFHGTRVLPPQRGGPWASQLGRPFRAWILREPNLPRASLWAGMGQAVGLGRATTDYESLALRVDLRYPHGPFSVASRYGTMRSHFLKLAEIPQCRSAPTGHSNSSPGRCPGVLSSPNNQTLNGWPNRISIRLATIFSAPTGQSNSSPGQCPWVSFP